MKCFNLNFKKALKTQKNVKKLKKEGGRHDSQSIGEGVLSKRLLNPQINQVFNFQPWGVLRVLKEGKSLTKRVNVSSLHFVSLFSFYAQVVSLIRTFIQPLTIVNLN